MIQQDCLSDQQLRRLASSAELDESTSELLLHLDHCHACRQRLDAATRPLTLPPELTQDLLEPPPSAALAQAMQQLRGMLSDGTDPAIGKTSPSEENMVRNFSFLQPTDKSTGMGRLGKYEILEVVGRGGMGVVFKALDPTLHRLVAIKAVPAILSATPDAHERFLREARSIAAVQHDNIVTVFAADEIDGVPFLVMEYISGDSLAERLAREGRLPIEDIVRIGVETSRALQVAHSQGLVHRDIKPANILLDDSSGSVKVTDFGLAKTGVEDSLTETGTLAGTPEFMSPEQAAGEEVDARSDLFSLGSVLYMACAGESPFRAESTMKTIRRIVEAEPTRLADLCPQAPDWLENVILQLLQKDPQQRIQTADELQSLLQTQSAPAAGRNGSWRTVNPAPTSFSRTRRVALMGFALLAIGGLIAAVARRDSTPPPVSSTPAAPQQDGFTIVRTSTWFAELAEAIEAASEDEVIEVVGDGPFLVPPLEIHDKRLTLRAARGSIPKLMSPTPGAASEQAFLSSNADLRLEGLEIHWSMATRGIEFIHRSAIVVKNARLELVHCRLVTGQRSVCFGVTQGNVVVRHCHLQASAGGCAFWSPGKDQSMSIQQSVLEGSSGGLMISRSRMFDPLDGADLNLDRNTFHGEKVLVLLINTIRSEKLRINAEQNLFDAKHFLCIAAVRRSPMLLRVESAFNVRMLAKALTSWSEKANVHRKGAEYLSFAFMRSPNQPISADVGALADWRALWQDRVSDCVEAELRQPEKTEAEGYAPPQVVSASGELPIEFGPSLSQLGPRRHD